MWYFLTAFFSSVIGFIVCGIIVISRHNDILENELDDEVDSIYSDCYNIEMTSTEIRYQIKLRLIKLINRL